MSGHDPANIENRRLMRVAQTTLKPIDFARLDQILHTRVPYVMLDSVFHTLASTKFILQ
jgi:hypothetical protein